MVAPSSKPIMWTVIIATIIVLAAGFIMVNSIKDSMPETPTMPSAEAIAGAVLLNVNIPTAAEIAALVDVPEVETIYSVRDEKKSIAEDLATDELTDRTFKEWLAEELDDGLTLPSDFDYKDIKSISIKDVEVDLNGWSQESATVKFVARVYMDDNGDEESVRVEFSMDVDDLVYDDDYEDAEVDEESFDDFEITKCYNDFCSI